MSLLLQEATLTLLAPTDKYHNMIDQFGKANNLVITYAPWHTNPEYRIFKAGSLLSKNDKYPSGLVIINEKGEPKSFL